MSDRPELGQNIGRDVQVLRGPRGHLAFYGKHKTKKGYRAGIICDEVGKGKNDGSVGGHRYFTCKGKQGLLVDPKKVKLLPGDEAQKKVWLQRAKHIKKLNRAFDRLMRSKQPKGAEPVPAAAASKSEGTTQDAAAKADENTESDDQPKRKVSMADAAEHDNVDDDEKPTSKTKMEATRRMEKALKESRKSIKKGGLNKYSNGVIETKRDRDQEMKEVYEKAGEVANASRYSELLFKASDATAEEMRARAAQRATEVLTIREQVERAEQERLAEERQAAEDAQLEALTAAEEAEIIKAAEMEEAQLALEEDEWRATHAKFSEKTGGVSRLSLKKTSGSKGADVHPMLAMVNDFVGDSGGDAESAWLDDE